MKYLLIFLLGFLSHKGLEEIYDYSFYKKFKVCGPQYLIDSKDKSIDAPLTKRFQCTYNEMGIVYILSYVLMRPHWTSNDNNGRWYY